MEGPEHYRRAERAIAEFKRTGDYGDIAAAQAHATLALAAATAWPVVDRYKGDSCLTNEWSDVIGWVMPAHIVEDED